jgi:predicted hydrocarbon binding protein
LEKDPKVSTVKNEFVDLGLLHRDENGVLRDNLSNRRVIILSCSAYRAMCDSLYDQFQSGAGVILYRMGEGYGRKLVNGVPQLGMSKEEMVDALAKLSYLAGWGKLTINISEDSNGDAVLEDSPFTLRRNDIGPTTCHFMSGVLTGGASELFGVEYKTQEIKCSSHGESKVCRFAIHTKNISE